MGQHIDNSLPTIALVRAAIARRLIWKDVTLALADRPPDEDSAKHIIAAHEDKNCPPWLAANLLGAIRHPIGYEPAMRILEASPGNCAEGYAAGSMVAIDRERALVDLTRLLTEAETPRARRGAAHGLARFPMSPKLVRLMFMTAVDSRISFGPVRSAFEEGARESARILDCVVEVLVTPLEDRDEKRVRLMTEVAWWAFNRVRNSKEHHELLERLRPSIEKVVSDPDVGMLPRKRRDLSAWLEQNPGA